MKVDKFAREAMNRVLLAPLVVLFIDLWLAVFTGKFPLNGESTLALVFLLCMSGIIYFVRQILDAAKD